MDSTGGVQLAFLRRGCNLHNSHENRKGLRRQPLLFFLHFQERSAFCVTLKILQRYHLFWRSQMVAVETLKAYKSSVSRPIFWSLIPGPGANRRMLLCSVSSDSVIWCFFSNRGSNLPLWSRGIVSSKLLVVALRVLLLPGPFLMIRFPGPAGVRFSSKGSFG